MFISVIVLWLVFSYMFIHIGGMNYSIQQYFMRTWEVLNSEVLIYHFDFLFHTSKGTQMHCLGVLVCASGFRSFTYVQRIKICCIFTSILFSWVQYFHGVPDLLDILC